MGLIVTWPTPANGFVANILVPKADTTLVSAGPPEIRNYNLDAFRAELGTLWASEPGAPYSKPFIHTGERTVSGFTYAREVLVLNPYRVEFEDGAYVVQLFGANHNTLDVINANSVSVQAQNSAGLINVLQLYQSAYYGSIWIDVDNGTPGTSVQGGNGTPGNPVNNFDDAYVLSMATNLKDFTVLNGTIAPTVAMDDYRWVLRNLTSVNLNGQTWNGATITGGGEVEGTGAGGVLQIEGCHLHGTGGVEFDARRCRIEGTLGLVTGNHTFQNCISGTPGTSMPELSFVGPGAVTVSLRAMSGGAKASNMTANDVATFEWIAGQCETVASCTGGVLVLRGDCEPVTRGDAGTTVIDNTTARAVWNEFVATQRTDLVSAILAGVLSGGYTLGTAVDLARKALTNRFEQFHGNPGRIILYDDDDVTPLLTQELRDGTGSGIALAVQVPAKRSSPV